MKELVVVAIGGNSIIKDNASQSIEHQAEAVKAVVDTVLEMLASDYDIVLTHGNGPQVGLDLRRAEIAHEREGLPLTPLANCVADTQGGIGYLIQQALNNRLARHGEKKAVTVVTQVEVDKNDPGFAHPTKPIGEFFSESQRDELQKANPDWRFVEDAGRGYRRVVASPEPKRIVEAPAIKALIQQGFVVIGAGGGGIPVVRTEAGDYQSVDAVIDKDLYRATGSRNSRRHSGDHHWRRKSVYSLWQTAAAGAGSRRYCHHDPLYAGRAFPTWQHVAKNHRQPDVPGTRRQRSDYHHAGMPACGATRRNGHPYY